jgi:hypothetical protein
MATTYCYYPPNSQYFDGENKREWTMTASKFRRILMPTQTKPTTSCAVNFSNIGTINKLSFIKKPTLNSADIWRGYQINYQALKSGEDTMIIEIEWFDRSNNLRRGTVSYTIHVVEHEL